MTTATNREQIVAAMTTAAGQFASLRASTPTYLGYVVAGAVGAGNSEGVAAPAQVVVVIAADDSEARRLADDIRGFLAIDGGEPSDGVERWQQDVLHLPSRTVSPYAEIAPDTAGTGQTMAALARLLDLRNGLASAPRCLVTSIAALARRVIDVDEFARLSITLKPGESIARDELAAQLVAAGYVRMPLVDDVGTFAVRGEIVDVFPSRYAQPIRIEFFGDELETVRSFDPNSQRTLRQLDDVRIHPVRDTIATAGADIRSAIFEAADAAAQPSSETLKLLARLDTGDFPGLQGLVPAFHRDLVPLWKYLPEGVSVVTSDRAMVFEQLRGELEAAKEAHSERIAQHRIAFPVASHYSSFDEIVGFIDDGLRLNLLGIDPGQTRALDDIYQASATDHSELRARLRRSMKTATESVIKPLVDAILTWRKDDYDIVVATTSPSRRNQLLGSLQQADISVSETAGDIRFVNAALRSGFVAPADGLVVLSDSDIFGSARGAKTARRSARSKKASAFSAALSDFSQLELGDFLVHEVHGVGLYRGLAKLPVNGTEIDFLHVEYRGGNLYVPVFRFNEVQRYIGADGKKPRIDKLGGSTWQTTRGKVSAHVRVLAEQLLQLYAQRATVSGYAFPASDSLFDDFEAAFEHEETPDQQAAIDSVIADMENATPMDRLVCGDVGYGKTEVALRGILKAALAGKQSVLLAPTTVLVEQHYKTMSQRFDAWPIRVGRLSRFISKVEQQRVVSDLASGKLDVVVGTHRLLSKDVRFHDLGLVVVDEEQRFGVAHKERLKTLRAQVDVLTLTATPIPRTLHLAMTGLRDLSIIATPPVDRRAVRTFVAHAEDGVIREAIERELQRGGQVFFVCPRVHKLGAQSRSIDDWKSHLEKLVPDARIGVAHGQLPVQKLEKAMVEFVAGRFNVLLATTIVESGLDIPTANTMLVADAQGFGLSQLYQLRGRIGRSSRRAYCYLLIPDTADLTQDARRRLEALQRFSELGAGFQVASQDLEIRGAGELLGAKQSGSIAAVGFDAYTQMLEDAVAELRGEPVHRELDPVLNASIVGYIPDDYVPDMGQRLDLYKRLSSADSEDDVQAILAQIADCYGNLPDEVIQLGELNAIKVYARRLRAHSVDLGPATLVIALRDASQGQPTIDGDRLANYSKLGGGHVRPLPDGRIRVSLEQAVRERNMSPAQAAKVALVELIECIR